MNNNTPNDLEQLLQQYGRDRRQQQTAETHVRGLARRNRRMAATLSSVAIIVVVTWLFFTFSPNASSPVTASIQENNHIPNTTNNFESHKPHHPIQTQNHETNNTPKETAKLKAPGSTPTAPHTTETQPAGNQGNAYQSENYQMETPNIILLDANHTDTPSPYIRSKNFQPTTNEDETSILLTPIYNPTTRKPSLRVVAEVGATLGSSVSSGNPSGNNRLQAAVALNLALASGHRYSLSAGLGLGGNMRTDVAQMSYGIDRYSYTFLDGIDNTDEFHPNSDFDITENVHYPYYDPLFGLYATLPLTFDFYPYGHSHTGLQLSLTPAHSIVLSRHNSLFNPWKLNLGIGLSIPDNPIRSIGLTANLLPSFTGGPYKNIHEIGLVVSF